MTVLSVGSQDQLDGMVIRHNARKQVKFIMSKFHKEYIQS
jgi:hypothetical protein